MCNWDLQTVLCCSCRSCCCCCCCYAIDKLAKTVTGNVAVDSDAGALLHGMLIVGPPPSAAVAPQETTPVPRAQEVPGAHLGPTLEALASAVDKYFASGPSSAEGASSARPTSDEMAPSDAHPGLTTREAQAPHQQAQVPALPAAPPPPFTAAAGPAAGSPMLAPPPLGPAPAAASSHSKDSSLSEYEMVRGRRVLVS